MTPRREEPAAPDGPDAVLRALADPHRRQILRLVQRDELPAGQIAAHFDLTQQAVSQHLTVLKRAGLLAERRDGTRRLYSLRSGSLEPLRALLDEFWPDALSRLKQAVEGAHPRAERPRTGRPRTERPRTEKPRTDKRGAT
ncbi:MAG TPA: metalloregulator ArsR/SmtB family transcription factor [Acidimicrobiales bacterium]|nr:metalloregulator ArsR/SmtB family transcription factor [Acidimicrobiales bacterium]